MELANADKSWHKQNKKKKQKDLSEPGGRGGGGSEAKVDDDGKKKKKKKRNGGVVPTVSIAIAGSIIDNAQSLELATLLAGQIARAATIFRIDEVVVFDSTAAAENAGGEGDASGARFLVRILQYLETPQYLRRRLFPMHKSLKFVGLLPPLDAPHHVRKHEWSAFREGVTLDGDRSKGTLVDVGLSKNVLVEQILESGKRVTVAMGIDRDITSGLKLLLKVLLCFHVVAGLFIFNLKIRGVKTLLSNFAAACVRKVVPSSSPRDEMGLYWGYKVRYASSLSGVFSDSPYEEGYDHIIGTSEHGQIISSSELIIPAFRHLLIAFGGLAGLEESIEEDKKLKGKGVNDVFISYLNICPHQGSRTIRTEEALLICLQYFQDPIGRAEQRK